MRKIGYCVYVLVILVFLHIFTRSMAYADYGDPCGSDNAGTCMCDYACDNYEGVAISGSCSVPGCTPVCCQIGDEENECADNGYQCWSTNPGYQYTEVNYSCPGNQTCYVYRYNTTCNPPNFCSDTGCDPGHYTSGTCNYGESCCTPSLDECLPYGERCNGDVDCCSGFCRDSNGAGFFTHNRCVDDADCKPALRSCSSSSECCSKRCNNGVCDVITDDDVPHLDDITYEGPTITSLGSVISPVAKILYYAGLFIGIGFIVYSGYILMTSEGNPERVQLGKDHLTSAITGIILILLSAALLRVIIQTFFGIEISI